MKTVDVDLIPTCQCNSPYVRHVWDQQHWVLNGYPSGTGIHMNDRYECPECGKPMKLREAADADTND